MIKKRKKALIFGILCISAISLLSTACNTKQSQDTNIRPNANNLKTEKIALKALLEGITDQNTRDSLSDEIDKANTKEMIENIKSKIQSIIIKNKQDLFELEKKYLIAKVKSSEIPDASKNELISLIQAATETNLKELENQINNKIKLLNFKKDAIKNIDKIKGSSQYNHYLKEIQKSDIGIEELSNIISQANIIFENFKSDTNKIINELDNTHQNKNELINQLGNAQNIDELEFIKQKAELYKKLTLLNNAKVKNELKEQLDKVLYKNIEYQTLLNKISQNIDENIIFQNLPPKQNLPEYQKIDDATELLVEVNKQESNINTAFIASENKPELVTERYNLAKAYKELLLYKSRQQDYGNNIDELNAALKSFLVKLNELNNKTNDILLHQNLEAIKTNINTTTNQLNTSSAKHSLGFDLIFDKTNQKYYAPNDIVTKTPYYQKQLSDFKNYLKTANNGSGVDLTNNRLDYQFLNHLKEVGIYGEYGDNDEQKWRYFFNGYKKEFMMKALFLESFESIPLGSIEISLNDQVANKIKGIIKQNPFGYLPSNLSQFFYYIDLKTIKQMIDFNDDINSIKTKYDDQKGELSILFETNSGSFKHLNINTSNSLLKKNSDFFQYIYDRSFSLQHGGIRTIRPEFGAPPFQSSTKVSGTAWIIDRIKSPLKNKSNKKEYEFLVATNAHVASLNHIFDRSLVYNDILGKKDIQNWVGEINQNFNFNKHNYESNSNDQTINNYENYLKKPLDNHLGTNTKDQYLDWIYYTPRFKSTGLRANRNVTNFFDEVTDTTNRLGTINNSGADFAILKLRFTKENIRDIFPTLYDVLDTPAEKDWYIGLGNETTKTKSHESPIQTHFVLGFPDINGSIKLNGARSQGGYIESTNRVIDNDKNGKNNFNSLWVRYNEAENKDWNKLNNKWMDYTEPFKRKSEHGMAKNILQQLSTLYLNNENNESLNSGSSGSMVIDSRFNLVGINFAHVVESDDPQNKGNQIVLFKGEGQYDKNEFSGDIKSDFIDKLHKDNLKTIKLNP
ncbi:MAG2960 family serine endopeptidase lipoprotein [Mycoplasmopsis cynos]|uniref:Lipoprotein, putative n=2 Tax=Mycoplasmopsis cynos TaxID=171284 RepID=L0RVJ7_MYCC1|nr:lipoprotein, putative [Mycoplasmopsis cynos]CCP24107.1 Lipoprotein, putative [Mycoplasmopsis cynos C142]